MLMIGSLKRYGFILLSAAILCAASSAGGVYMVCVGPTPLRFKEATLRLDPAAVLPPLAMTDGPSTNEPAMSASEISIPEAKNEPKIISTTPVVVSSSEGAATNTETVTNAPLNSQNATTSQVLLHYFNGFNGGTNQEAFVSAPVLFTPPVPSGNRSSATYVSQ